MKNWGHYWHYIYVYIYYLYTKSDHTTSTFTKFFCFLWYIGSSVQQKASQVKFYLQYIYIYFCMYRVEVGICSRDPRPPLYSDILPWGKDRSQEFVKSPSARNGQRRSFCPLCNRLQGYWKPGRTNLGAICQWAANDCPCMECGGPCWGGDNMGGLCECKGGLWASIISPGVPGLPPMETGGVILFSFCLLLQNQTRTTSFSSCRLSARPVISWAEGLGCLWKWFSRAPLTETSILVRFLRFLPWAAILSMEVGEPVVLSASSNHLARRGFNLHMFLKLNCSASNLKWQKQQSYFQSPIAMKLCSKIYINTIIQKLLEKKQ